MNHPPTLIFRTTPIPITFPIIRRNSHSIDNEENLCDIVWVDQWVNQNSTLTRVHVDEILSIDLVTALDWCLH